MRFIFLFITFSIGSYSFFASNENPNKGFIKQSLRKIRSK